jgi:hypothetical protein
MRWDIWWRGALASGVLAVISVAPAVVQNGVTKVEAWALLSVFLGGIALWRKEHKLEWDGVERRETPPPDKQ